MYQAKDDKLCRKFNTTLREMFLLIKYMSLHRKVPWKITSYCTDFVHKFELC